MTGTVRKRRHKIMCASSLYYTVHKRYSWLNRYLNISPGCDGVVHEGGPLLPLLQPPHTLHHLPPEQHQHTATLNSDTFSVHEIDFLQRFMKLLRLKTTYAS